VHPPGSDGFEPSAVASLLDVLPAGSIASRWGYGAIRSAWQR